MSNVVSYLLVTALVVYSFFTGQVAVVIMLGFILIALHNILRVLYDISRKLDRPAPHPAGQHDGPQQSSE